MNKLKTLAAKLPFGKSGFSWKLNLCILAAILAIDGHLAYTQHRIRRDYAELVTADKRLNEAAKRLEQTTVESKQQFSRLGFMTLLTTSGTPDFLGYGGRGGVL